MTDQHLTAESSSAESPPPETKRLLWWLGGSAFVSWWLYVAVTWISRRFAYEIPGQERPLILILVLLTTLFGLYLFQVAITKRICAKNTSQHSISPHHTSQHSGAIQHSGETQHSGEIQHSGAMPLIIVFSVAFRMMLLFSEPIQEVDAYRYLWDGKVLTASISPFRYSPEQFLKADANHDHPTDVSRLIELRDQSVANAQILSRVHFGHLTTVYPPTSQAVFGVAAWVTPNSTSVQNHLLVIKTFIVVFDLATLWFLILILQHVGKPPEWSVIYGWCPLVMKEFANSGHLDSIAVCLSIATAYCALKAFYPRHAISEPHSQPRTNRSAHRWTFVTAIVLSLAIGAKIYPIILAPLLFLSAWKKVSPLAAVLAGIIVLTLSIIMVTPMLSRDQPESVQIAKRQKSPDLLPPPPTILESKKRDTGIPDDQQLSERRLQSNQSVFDLPPPSLSKNEQSNLQLPEGRSPVDSQAPTIKSAPVETGLSAFTSQWQMNDFLFLLIAENLRGERQGPTAWFVIVPEVWRESVVNFFAENTTLQRSQVPFLATRFFTSLIFVVLATCLAWRVMDSPSANHWLRVVFLTIAWFWLLQPTQNPWYWTWALPFVPFARSRAWLAVSGLVLIYYARFWFSYHASETPIAGTPYIGVTFFDYVLTWVEFGPWFLWLIWTSIRSDSSEKTNTETPSNAATA